jgi:hypothetical protein
MEVEPRDRETGLTEDVCDVFPQSLQADIDITL